MVGAECGEGAQGGLASEVELAFALGEIGRETGLIDQSATGQDEAGEFREGSGFERKARGLDGHFVIEEAGVESEDAGETPIDGSEFAGEAHFDRVGGADAADVGTEQFFKSAAILVGEHDGVIGEAAVLEGIPGRTRFSRRSVGALRLGPIDSRLFGTFISTHVSILTYGVGGCE